MRTFAHDSDVTDGMRSDGTRRHRGARFQREAGNNHTRGLHGVRSVNGFRRASARQMGEEWNTSRFCFPSATRSPEQKRDRRVGEPWLGNHGNVDPELEGGCAFFVVRLS